MWQARNTVAANIGSMSLRIAGMVIRYIDAAVGFGGLAMKTKLLGVVAAFALFATEKSLAE
jgi:hypothetical protein